METYIVVEILPDSKRINLVTFDPKKAAKSFMEDPNHSEIEIWREEVQIGYYSTMLGEKTNATKVLKSLKEKVSPHKA